MSNSSGSTSISYWWFILAGILIYGAMLHYSTRLTGDSLGWFNLYLQIGTITIFIINLLLTLDNYRQQVEDRHKSFYLKYANIAQMKLNDIDKLFFSTPTLTRLYFEMYGNDPHIQRITSMMPKHIKPTPEILKAEHHASSIIFQTMADIYMAGLVDRDGQFYCEDLIEWYNTFKKWFGSKILRRHWITLRDEHHPKFRRFIEQILIPGSFTGICRTRQKNEASNNNLISKLPI